MPNGFYAKLWKNYTKNELARRLYVVQKEVAELRFEVRQLAAKCNRLARKNSELTSDLLPSFSSTEVEKWVAKLIGGTWVGSSNLPFDVIGPGEERLQVKFSACNKGEFQNLVRPYRDPPSTPLYDWLVGIWICRKPRYYLIPYSFIKRHGSYILIERDALRFEVSKEELATLTPTSYPPIPVPYPTRG